MRSPTHCWDSPWGPCSARIDGASGMLATEMCPPDAVRDEWYLPGTEPLDYCPIHGDSGVGGWLRRRIGEIGDLLGQ